MMHKLKISSKLMLLCILITSILGFTVRRVVRPNSSISSKQIDKNFVKIPGLDKNLLCHKYELTNSNYKVFLDHLRKNDTALYEQCMYDSLNWSRIYPYSYTSSLMRQYHSNSAYGDYPIVNIQYSAALEYCKWLTKEYNSMKKRTYQKVAFRLPTEEEWIVATSCLPGGKLPWYGDKGYTSDLKYMANIKFAIVEAEGRTGPEYMADNALYMNRVGEYPMNANGLFDMIGNVAEMVSEEGKAKGGGWNSFISECYADQSQKYEGWGHPEVGFRLFMEIIEP